MYFSRLYILLSLVLLLPACHKQNPSFSSLDAVSIAVEQLPQSQVNSLFEGRGRHLAKAKDPIIPLRVTVENRNSYSVMVKPATMAITDSNIIYSQVKKNTAAIVTAGTIGGFFIVPVVGVAIGAGCGISSAKKNDRIFNEITENAFVGAKEVYPNSSFRKIMFVRESDFQPVFSLPVDVGTHAHTSKMIDLSGSALDCA